MSFLDKEELKENLREKGFGVICKVYKVYDVSNGTSIIGVIINTIERTLYLENIKGVALGIDGFIELLSQDYLGPIIQKIGKSYRRRNPYRLTHVVGSSGAMDFFIHWLERADNERFYRERKKEIFHLSMYQKLNVGVDIFIPDLVLLLEYLPFRKACCFSEVSIKDIEMVDITQFQYPCEHPLSLESVISVEAIEEGRRKLPSYLQEIYNNFKEHNIEYIIEYKVKDVALDVVLNELKDTESFIYKTVQEDNMLIVARFNDGDRELLIYKK